MTYRKKPAVIEAIKWDGVNIDEILALSLTIGSVRRSQNHSLVIETLEGDMIANRGDWIIKGIKGELYPCKSDIFESTYEVVD